MAAFVVLTGGDRTQAETLLLAGLEAIAPLAVAMVALTIVTREACRELHLSLPTPHLVTLGRRLGVLGAVTAVLCLIYAAVVALAGYRAGPGGVAAPLVWAAPALWLGGFAVLVAAISRSSVLTSSVVALVWLGEQVWAPLFAGSPLGRPLFLFFTSRLGDGPGWAANRLGLLAGGLVFLAVSAAILRAPERLLTEEDA